jgi:hypothetical protein
MANSSKKNAARQAVEKLERPEGISGPMWRGVQALLRCIADHYPNPYPSQRTLASLTGYSVASIERYVATAKAHGLLLVKADAGKKGIHNTWSRTNRYHIVSPSKRGDALPSECGPKPYGLLRSPPGKELRSSLSPRESSLSAIGISRFDPEGPSRQTGTGKSTGKPLAKTPPRRPVVSELVVDSGRRAPKVPRSPKQPPWRSTAARFLIEWDSIVTATTPDDYLRSVRPAETLGHFRSYLQATFYGPEATTPKTEAEVADLIAEFMTNVFRGAVRIKDGQSAWMAFIGAWGRNKRRGYHNNTEQTTDEYVPPQRRA